MSGNNCELSNKSIEQLYKVATPSLDDHHVKADNGSVGNLSIVCSHIVLKMSVSGSLW